eukprot:11287787-Alexandrium_andersonii.AAC.1
MKRRPNSRTTASGRCEVAPPTALLQGWKCKDRCKLKDSMHMLMVVTAVYHYHRKPMVLTITMVL